MRFSQRLAFLGPILLALALVVPAAQAQTIRVLLVGDSWPDFMWFNQSLRTVFAAEGFPEILEKGDVTAISGSTASEWVTPSFLQMITDELAANPTIDVVQLTIGGNDFLAGMPGGGWYQGISEGEEEALFLQIVTDVGTVIDHVLSLDPQIEVLLSTYDHPNFVETLGGILGFFCNGVWQDLGQPTPEQINLAGMELGDRIEAMAASKPRTTTVRHDGLMQFVFGYPSMGILPGQLLLPGDLTLPSPPQAMNLQADCFHLNPTGYEALAQNLWDRYYVLRFGNAEVFADGFESGSTSAWSSGL